MGKAKRFEEFEKLYENTTGGYPQSSVYNHQIDDYSLSSDPSDRFANNVKSGVFRMNSIFNDLFSSGFLSTGHTNDYSDLEKVTELKLLRTFRKEHFLVDIYLSFVLDDVEYYAVFENYGSYLKYDFKSEIYNNPEYNKNFLIKLEGILLKALKRFYKPERGMYKALTNVNVKDKNGVLHTIKPGKAVKVEKVVVDDNTRYIHLEIKNGKDMEAFYIKDQDYFFFNYVFGEYTNKDIK